MDLWRSSPLFRRMVAGVALVAVVVLLYFAANIPRPVSLPYDDVNKLAVTHFGDELRIYQPKVEEGDAVLSYEGASNELAEVWLDHATPTGISRTLLAAVSPDQPGPVVYTVADPAKVTGREHCRTTVVVRRANGTPSPKEIDLAQRDPGSGDQQFRQLVLQSVGTALQVEVHTDADVDGPHGLTLCPRMVSLGQAKVDVAAGPLYFSVPDGWINLRFISVDPDHPAFADDNSTLDQVSLGEDGLQASGFDIVSGKVAKTPLLHVQANGKAASVTLDGLKIAARAIKLDVGKPLERADAAANGTRIGPLNLTDLVQKNLALSGIIGAAIAALLKWEQQIFFPAKPEEPRKKRAKRKEARPAPP